MEEGEDVSRKQLNQQMEEGEIVEGDEADSEGADDESEEETHSPMIQSSQNILGDQKPYGSLSLPPSVNLLPPGLLSSLQSLHQQAANMGDLVALATDETTGGN